MTGLLIWALWIVSGLLILALLIPLSNLRHGAVQGLSFPRAQFLVTSLICALLFLGALPQGPHWGMAAVMMAVAAGQMAYIIRFTPIWPQQSVTADCQLRGNKDARISLLAANVKMSNRSYDRLVTLVRQTAPDVVMAIEVDADWITALKAGLFDQYSHWIEVPQDNGYGLCVISRLPLSDAIVRDYVTEGVPSVKVKITLRSGAALRLYVVHPEPPVIDHDTKGRDSEIAIVGLEAARDPLPAIVSGDLNDVAWSANTRQFQRLSQLLDPRIGRGFYNTFSATHPWMRWPLDHLFHDARFRFIEMKRLGKIGSDHFPMWFELALATHEDSNVPVDTPTSDEVADTKDMIHAEKKRDREAIGSTWEKDVEEP